MDAYLSIPAHAALRFPELSAHTRLRLQAGDVLRVPLRILPYEGPVVVGPPVPGPADPADLQAHLSQPEDEAPWLQDPACTPAEAEHWLRAEAFRRCPREFLLASLLGLPKDALAGSARRVRVALAQDLLGPLGIPGNAWGEGLLAADSSSFSLHDGIHEGHPTTPPDLTAGYGDGHDVRLDRIAERFCLGKIDLNTALQRAPHAHHAVLRLAQVLDQVVSIIGEYLAFWA
jgi:hypothetical protein